MKTLILLISLFLSESVFAKETRYYSNAIEREDYETALFYVCIKYKLDCKKVKIVNPSVIEGSYATTHPYTNTIQLSTHAFSYYGRPHSGWVGAIILHENVHQGQSRYVRQVAGIQTRIMKDRYWEGIVEMHAWSEMMVHSKRFDLTKLMIDEIQENIDYYTAFTKK